MVKIFYEYHTGLDDVKFSGIEANSEYDAEKEKKFPSNVNKKQGHGWPCQVVAALNEQEALNWFLIQFR